MDLSENGSSVDVQAPGQQAGIAGESAPLNRIRVETALSRFPIHRLAKKENVTIDIERLAENGEPDVRWEVTYNQKHGQPGPLAYKVDTLIVNRRIDAAGRPLPGVIKLGSLTELCASLGVTDSGENRANLRKALHQNASAYITAKIRYRTKTGKERWGEIGYTRYSVVFTGEVLPDGSVANAVYIIPNPSFRELLNHVEVRPLDYDYLVRLAPGPQRFYELLSFQIYGALAGGRPRAKLLYSDYCNFAPQVRYPNFERVKKQMYKLHLPHREAGYITKVEYQETTDSTGAADWQMFYTPGPKAIAEFKAFTRRQVRREELGIMTALPAPSDSAINVTFLGELARRGIAEKKGRELLINLKPGQELMDQLEYVDSVVVKDRRSKLENPPGLYIHYVQNNLLPPAEFLTSRKRRLHADLKQTREDEKARNARLKLEYESYCAAETGRYIREAMPPEEYHEIVERHRRQNRNLLKHLTEKEIAELTDGTVRSEIRDTISLRLQSYDEFLKSVTSMSVS